MQALLPLLLLTAPTAAPPVAPGPITSVAIARSIDDLKATVAHLAGPLGQPDLIKQFNDVVDPLKGLDRSKPLGVFVRWPSTKTFPDLHNLVIFAILRDEKALLESCRAQGFKVVSRPREGAELQLPIGIVVRLRFAHGRVYASLSERNLQDLPAAETLSFPAKERAVLMVRLWPERARTPVYRMLDRELRPLFEEILKSEGANEIDPALRTQMGQIFRIFPQIWAEIVTWFSEITLSLGVDTGSDQVHFDLTVTPRPGTAPARLAKYLGKARGSFAPLVGDANLAIVVALPPMEEAVDEKALVSLPPSIQAAVPARYQDFVLKLAQTLILTLGNDGVDAALLTYPDSASVGVAKVRKGRKLDHLVRDTYRRIPTSERKALPFLLNHERIGDTRVHRLTVMKESMLIAVREDLLAIVDDDNIGRKRLGKILSTKLMPASQPGPYARVDIRGDLLLSDESSQKAFQKRAPKVDLDKVFLRMQFEGGSALRLRVQMHTHMLTLLRIVAESQ
jgi:hypothetical protein